MYHLYSDLYDLGGGGGLLFSLKVLFSWFIYIR